MLQIWTVEVEDGSTTSFGNAHADIWPINRLHFKAASDFECDHVSNVLYLPDKDVSGFQARLCSF